MVAEKLLLNVGDDIYQVGSREVVRVITIDRVTDKSAFANHFKFKREHNGKYLSQIGGSPFDGSFFLPTDELKQKHLRTINLRDIRICNFEKLNDSQLERILEIINE
ncbi:hypothetical protein [Dyadobacter bucti]|uniref:hypothetical protein n=1 Tax=Dyadobacter bucti TaxID=2572203 RepID=UPI0011085DE3|nr:hypothetical protein [Dyadobacter bucti]